MGNFPCSIFYVKEKPLSLEKKYISLGQQLCYLPSLVEKMTAICIIRLVVCIAPFALPMLRRQHVTLCRSDFLKVEKAKNFLHFREESPALSAWKQDVKIIAWQQKCPWIFLTYNKCRNWAERLDCQLKQLINTNQQISLQRRMGYDDPRRLFNIMSKATNIKRLQFTPVSRCWKSF